MNYLAKINEIKKEIINSLQVAVKNAENNSISLKDYDWAFEYEELGLDWRGELVLVDNDGYGYDLANLSTEELAELTDWILSNNK